MAPVVYNAGKCDMRASSQRSCFTHKGLTMTDHETNATTEELDQHVFALLKRVIQKSHDCSAKDEVSRALLCFLWRVANTWLSIRTLRQHSPDENLFIVDAGVLLRAMFDACFQAEYLVQDADSANARANDYLEYEHVERYRISRKVLSHDNELAERLRSSSKRPEGEKRVQEEYDRVKDRYLPEKRRSNEAEKRRTRPRNTWYSGNLATIAQSLGKQAEYDTFVTVFNGCVHSSALAVNARPMVSPQYVLTLASKIAARVARLNVQQNRIHLGDFYGPIMDALCKDVLVSFSDGGTGV